MEQELTKAQKVIQKSKKVTEVQGLVRDNESMQRKLISQEEDFRIQNQTLLDELSKVWHMLYPLNPVWATLFV
jgi:hypothetical protein